ncbi:MAG: N-formylglutamate amidohydrolase [Ilumatobacteraceae bacterium]|nr:N-formylglutamate amidohydrolase [Ilumatobacteraceae bacterium]
MLFKQNPLVRQWTALNAPFASNSNRGPKEGPRWIIDWNGPLFVSAVHAVDHERNGAWKNTDAGTGGLAMTLSNVVDCSKVAVTRSVPMMGDANWDEYHPLKAQLEKLGHVGDRSVYIDLHGMKDGHGADVIIGCGNGSPASIALGQRVAAHLEAAKVTTDPDGGRRGFGATKPGTMTSWAQRQGATAVQIEISRSYRAAQSADKLKERLITGLVAALLEEKSRLTSIPAGFTVSAA